MESVENQGSTFRVWLPLTEMREELTAASSNATAPLVAETVLSANDAKCVWVVEDQPYNQALMSDVLELEGYRVELISDGGAMMTMIQSSPTTPQPDLILLDIQLPKVDGLEILRHLKASPAWQNIPVIAVTAMAMTGDRDRCLAAGASAYLSKPLNLNLLIETVRTLINSAPN